ncbi:MAG: hypothetical protein HY746_08155 [Elusimicrobia bacterium]|nr:hypothetical protein [Elusimicrobiota bacterium]
MKRNSIFAKQDLRLQGRIAIRPVHYGKASFATTLFLLLFTNLNAQTKALETNSVTSGLAISTSPTQKLESVIGEISGVQITGGTRKLLSGHSRTSHSPGVVSDIAVSTQSVLEGEISLWWTHKGRDGNVGQASSFDVKIASVPITYSNYASVQSVLSVTALSPGTTSQRTISNLPPGQMYYLSMRTKDSANLFGRISQNATFYTVAIPPDPISSLQIQTSSAGLINLSWNVTGDDGNTGNLNPGYFRIDYSTDAGHSFANTTYAAQISTTASSGSAQYYSVSNLLGNATYYATVYIGDEVTIYSGLSQIAQILTQAYPPSLSSFSSISTGSFTVNFSANNLSGTEYYVQASSVTDYSVAVSSGWTSSALINFTGLTPKTTYYVKAKARNFSSIETIYASIGSIFLPAVSGTYKPGTPLASASISGSNLTLSWQPVTMDIMGNSINIKEYKIYMTTGVGGSSTFITSVSSSVFSYTETLSGTKWYFVKAKDIYNNESDSSLWLKNIDASAKSVSNDNNAFVDIPKSVNSILISQQIIPFITRNADDEVGNTVSSYKLYFKDSQNNMIYNQNFPNNVTLTLPLKKQGVGAGSLNPKIVYSPHDYAVFYNNGVEEVKLGGSVDSENGNISVVTAKTGSFKVKQVLRAQSFTITQTVPKKIFTPNGDGVWDEFHIIFENPAGLPVSGAKVFSLDGAEIGTLRQGTYNSEASLMWDGRNKEGDVANSGIYIYQFKAGDKYCNGTMVLAK